MVKGIRWQDRAEGYTVYNLIVSEDHTYFVGNTNGGAWVHNVNCFTVAEQAIADYLSGFGATSPKTRLNAWLDMVDRGMQLLMAWFTNLSRFGQGRILVL